MPPHRSFLYPPRRQTVRQALDLHEAPKQNSKNRLVFLAVLSCQQQLDFFGFDVVFVVYLEAAEPSVKTFGTGLHLVPLDQGLEILLPLMNLQQVLKKNLKEVRQYVSIVFLVIFFIFSFC
jgi:hypothetical protein